MTQFAVIKTDDNTWDFESSDACEAEGHFDFLKATGTPCVLVQVLASTDDETSA